MGTRETEPGGTGPRDLGVDCSLAAEGEERVSASRAQLPTPTSACLPGTQTHVLPVVESKEQKMSSTLTANNERDNQTEDEGGKGG